jgi:hypothetical protein
MKLGRPRHRPPPRLLRLSLDAAMVGHGGCGMTLANLAHDVPMVVAVNEYP